MPTIPTVLLTGTPGPLLDFAASLIGAAAEAAGHPAPRLQRHNASVQDDEVLGAVRRGDACAVVVIDDPAACLLALVAAGHAPIEAARALTAIAAPLAGLSGAVIRLHRDMTMDQASSAILAGLGFSARPDARGWSQTATTRLNEAAAGSGVCPSGQEDEIKALVRDVVGPLFVAAATGIPATVTWPRMSLFWGDRPGNRLPRILDLTGPARVLAYGPYFNLPPGGWIVQTTLAFAPGATGAPIAVELFSDGLLGRGRFKPATAGVFAVSFSVEIRSAYLPNEIRVISEAGAIDGEIGVDHVLLTPRET